MNKIALRIGIYRHWNHLYYQGLSYVDPRFPLPLWNILKQDQNALRLLKGFYPLSKIEIHKTREVIDIYICRDRYVNSPLIGGSLMGNPVYNTGPASVGAKSPADARFARGNQGAETSELRMHRALLNIFKTRIQIFNLYTFPIHEAELLVGYLLREGGRSNTSSPLPHKKKTVVDRFRRLWKMGIIKGIKIKIQGRYKKSTRTQNEAYQFGQIPNTPTTNLRIKLFYASRVLLQSLGTSSLHIYIVYTPRPATGRPANGRGVDARARRAR